ncbi:MAG: 50S ribosomal protein L29 [Bacteroidales bacterium]|jgi:large subunit ribosomal protein L29|nr:50S ribosomal protein L29 [Bacteroidales bacterium]
MKNQLVLKELSTAELKERLDAERAMYQKMLLTHAVSPIENPNKIKESRKNIARCLTELRAREIAEQSK